MGRWIHTSPNLPDLTPRKVRSKTQSGITERWQRPFYSRTIELKFYLVLRSHYVAHSFYRSDSNNSTILNLYLTGTWGRKPRVQQNLTCGAQCSHSLHLLKEGE